MSLQHSQFTVSIAPEPLPSARTPVSIFLAGSIEMGKAVDWQAEVTKGLTHLPVTIFNPRRSDWDGNWKQDIAEPQFKEQVDWEMDRLESSDVIALYLQPTTMSPISLLELGMHAAGGKVVVCCPEGFWRRGNVQIVCHRYGLELVKDIPTLVKRLEARLHQAMENKANIP
ncbi:hypothetical protein EJ06DRAFT_529936 [Trichodelitschia bisporula]|uniref:Nucleoside 2-deoxyribosyltransferase like n=1 Tax=Trichodelitschia bisporula TaxID=703511 RepID=A0A6G1HXQ8_9PEZI|nr:hypothetical protein EJ06DRAFT_529936 [Trichodelitschia bisporula]